MKLYWNSPDPECREGGCPREVPSSYMDECFYHYNIRLYHESGRQAPTKLKPGRRFGRLKLIERIQDYVHWDEEQGEYMAVARWRCQCDCGKGSEVLELSLHNGDTKSCGCRQREAAAKTGRTRAVEMTGQVFGRLTVIKRVGTISKSAAWACRCECGKRVTATRHDLVTGHVRSCGCLSRDTRNSRADDLMGRRFGRLTVIGRTDNQTGIRRWICACECGKETLVRTGVLNAGTTKSCGCLRDEGSSNRMKEMRRS